MKPTPWLLAEPHRIQHPFGPAPYGSPFGAFSFPGPCAMQLKVIVSAGSAEEGLEPWDHVSVSGNNRCPNWAEMEYIKRIFFRETETAMQLHVPPSEHINCHPYCLHIWRPHNQKIPLPPSIMVGPKEAA